MVINTELLFPIYEQYGLRGVAFFDTGNSFNSFKYSEVRRSVGAGVSLRIRHSARSASNSGFRSVNNPRRYLSAWLL